MQRINVRFLPGTAKYKICETLLLTENESQSCVYMASVVAGSRSALAVIRASLSLLAQTGLENALLSVGVSFLEL